LPAAAAGAGQNNKATWLQQLMMRLIAWFPEKQQQQQPL
jgi:hypothetical protein